MEKTVLVPEEFFVDCEQQVATGLSGFRAPRAARTGKMGFSGAAGGAYGKNGYLCRRHTFTYL